MQEAMSTADEPAGASLTERIRLAVENDILGGQLAPGEPIDDKSLSTAFSVSRTPVREALLLLSAQGLVEILPRAGMRVRRPTASELVALLECLAELESACTRLAALRMGDDQRLALKRTQQQATKAAKAGDRPGYEAANATFHGLIYRGGGNPVLVEQLQATRKRLSAFRRRVMDQPGRLASASAEHDLIVEAVLAGDADCAMVAMREHILHKGKAVADLVLVHGAG
jgi:DNA-binding GntR family transcriptional regulator